MARSVHDRNSLQSIISGWLYIALKGVLLLIVMMGWFSSMSTGFVLKNKYADPSAPLTVRAPLLLPCELVRTEANYLLVYNSATGSLGVYDDNDAFVCSYRIPNIAQGTTEVYTAFGEMYIYQYRSHNVYRYGTRGEYLGCIQKTTNYEENRPPTNNIYDARGNCTAKYSIQQAGRILAFTPEEIYWQHNDNYFLQQNAFGQLIPVGTIDTQYTAGGYSIKWTTLVNAKGFAIDASPWYEQFRSSPMSMWVLMLICSAGIAILKQIATKLEAHGYLTTEPWQHICTAAKEHLTCLRKKQRV